MPRTVLVIAYHYPPENAVGGIRPYRFARHLPGSGWSARVLTAAPQAGHHDGSVLSVLDRSRETWEGKQDSAQFPSFAQHYTELAVRRFIFPGALGITWAREVARHPWATEGTGDQVPLAVLSSFPPLAAHLAGRRIARQMRIPWVADFRDPYAHAPTNRLGNVQQAIARRVEAGFVAEAAAIIMNTDSAAEQYRRLYPKAADKTHVIWNGFDPADRFQAMPTEPGDHRLLVHAGSLYAGRDPGLLLASLRRLRTAGHATAGRVRVQLVGPDELMPQERTEMVRGAAEGWVVLQPEKVPQAEARRLQQSAHGLLLIQPQSDVQVPGKLFEYLQIGRPVLALAPRDSAIERILARAGVPQVTVYPDDAPEVVDDKVREYLALPTEPVIANAWFQENFNAEHQARQLADILDRVTGAA